MTHVLLCNIWLFLQNQRWNQKKRNRNQNMIHCTLIHTILTPSQNKNHKNKNQNTKSARCHPHVGICHGVLFLWSNFGRQDVIPRFNGEFYAEGVIMEHFSDDSSDPDTPEVFKSGKYGSWVCFIERNERVFVGLRIFTRLWLSCRRGLCNWALQLPATRDERCCCSREM